MNTVFSHIVQRRLSHQSEDVATEALAFILNSSEPARRAFTDLLRRIKPDLPDLYFRTQRTAGDARPDMWGLDESNTPHVFIENKFWAGLTENQPVEYLRRLPATPETSVLLFTVPAARQTTVWSELERRLDKAAIAATRRDSPPGVFRVVETHIGPTLALISWREALAAIEARLADEERQRDLLQLRALCDAVDIDAFLPIPPEELTDQQTPALVVQLKNVVREAVRRGVADGVLRKEGLRPSHSWERIGRYLEFGSVRGVGGWFGVEFRLWRDYGRTPLWLVFHPTDWGRALEVRALLQPWADREGAVSAMVDGKFAVGIDVAPGEEKGFVVDSIVRVLGQIGKELKGLQEKEG